MLKEKAKLITRLHLFLDLIITAICFSSAYMLKKSYNGLSSYIDYKLVFAMIMIIWNMVFVWNDNYSSYRHKKLTEILFELYKSIFSGMMIFTLIVYILKLEGISRALITLFVILDLTALSLLKTIVYLSLKSIRGKGYNFRNVMIVGSKTRAKKFIANLMDHISSGYRVAGCLEVDMDDIGKEVTNGIKVTDSIVNLQKIIETNIIDELVFAMPLKKIENADKYISMAEDMGIKCRIIPDWQLHYLMFEPDTAMIRFESFLGVPTMALHMISPKDSSLLIKTFTDILLASIAMIILLPFFILTGILIKLSSKGPVFFKQERLGLNGRTFKVYKFRTMVENAEELLEKLKEQNEADGPAFKIKHDPRIIPFIGTFLRKTSLDELPQLINIIKGEMSIVGPRPPLPNEVKQYQIWQRRRLSMKPGLTCLWQIAPRRNEISFEEWMKMDLHYIDNWSLWLDWKLIFMTVKAMFTGAGR